MTLICCFDTDIGPILVADVLLSGPTATPISLPTVGAIAPLDSPTVAPVGIASKIHFVASDLAFAWAGHTFAAQELADRLKELRANSPVSGDDLQRAIDETVVGSRLGNESAFIGVTRSSRNWHVRSRGLGVRALEVRRDGVHFAVVAGSGAASADVAVGDTSRDGEVTPRDLKPFGAIMMFVGRLYATELLTGRVKEHFGGGFEIAWLSAEGFRFLPLTCALWHMFPDDPKRLGLAAALHAGRVGTASMITVVRPSSSTSVRIERYRPSFALAPSRRIRERDLARVPWSEACVHVFAMSNQSTRRSVIALRTTAGPFSTGGFEMEANANGVRWRFETAMLAAVHESLRLRAGWLLPDSRGSLAFEAGPVDADALARCEEQSGVEIVLGVNLCESEGGEIHLVSVENHGSSISVTIDGDRLVARVASPTQEVLILGPKVSYRRLVVLSVGVTSLGAERAIRLGVDDQQVGDIRADALAATNWGEVGLGARQLGFSAHGTFLLGAWCVLPKSSPAASAKCRAWVVEETRNGSALRFECGQGMRSEADSDNTLRSIPDLAPRFESGGSSSD